MVELLYLTAFLLSFVFGLAATPLMRWLALRLGVLDFPSNALKNHREPTPYLGGAAIFIAVAATLFILRFVTHFPTGTLRSLRAILLGGVFMAGVGLADDIRHGGLSVRRKFFFQFLAALLLIAFDIRIEFIQPVWLADVLTVLWVVGIINAFNLIDIMDGFAASQAFVAAMAFLFISLPTEEIYVNFTAAAVAGAALSFLPYNLSERMKIFMGDAGSLLLGFWMAALSLGTSYTQVNEVGLFAPLLILGLPVYDTLFVSIMRMKQGKSPFIGSKDHLALKIRVLGLSSREVVGLLAMAAAMLSAAAYATTWMPFYVSIFVFSAAVAVGLFVLVKLHKVEVP
jgi:UDP-GlcNAc:undecaprenyl-phosphate/decaprenyl-phosphate GlcNAc-1-phosphate transferase